MVPISVPGYSWPIDSRILAATNEPGFMFEFPFQRDMNIGNPVRFILAVAILSLIVSVSWGRSALVGHKAPLVTVDAAVLPRPMLDRIMLIDRICTSC